VKPPPFEYLAPRSLDEAVAALAEHGDEAKAMAGGQSLVPLLAFRLARPSVIVDLNGIGGLDGARLDGDTLELGALTRQRDVERLPGLRERCPMIVEAIEQVGHVAIRNRGTVGGSLAHADPAAEWTALALALDAELDLVGPGGARTVPAAEFLISYFTTALGPGELLTGLRLNVPNGRSGSCFLELARRHGDFAIAGVGALVTLDGEGSVGDARVALIGVGERAVRVAAAEELLRGRRPTAELFAEAAAAVQAELDPNSDVHATADYRRHVAGVLVRRALGQPLRRGAAHVEVGRLQSEQQELREPRRRDPEQRGDDLQLLVGPALGEEIPQPHRGRLRPTVAQRADHVEPQRVRRPQHGDQCRHRLLAAAPHQQVERFRLDRRVAVGQRSHEHDLGARARYP